MSQTQTIGKHKTHVSMSNNENGSSLEVYYHNTCVVLLSNKYITLDTGGWWTVTTKLRMNQASNEYNLGYQVYQKDYAWFVTHKGETIPFTGNRITLKRYD